MRSLTLVIAVAATSLALAGCGRERKAEADTGTAHAEVTTQAPPAKVPDAQLQEQAQQAATAASTPVDGTGPVPSTTAAPPAAPARK